MYKVSHICVAVGPREYPFFARVMCAVLVSTTMYGGWRNNDQAENFNIHGCIVHFVVITSFVCPTKAQLNCFKC